MSKNKKNEEKRVVTSNRGNVELEVRGKGIIHLRFPLSVSKSIFDVKRQKYISLGLTADKEENWQKAREIQNTAQKDVLDKTVDRSGKKYKADYFYQSIVDLKERTPSTYDLCIAWAEEYRLTVKPTTYRRISYVLEMLKAAPKNLLDPFSIREWITELNNAPWTIDDILFILNHAIDWGIKKGHLDDSIPNPYSSWKPYLVGGSQKRIPKIAKEKGFGEDFCDIRGFTAEEATEIMEAFKYAATGRYYNIIKFKFLTGCRTGEAFGAKWKDFDEVRSIFHFRRSYAIGFGDTSTKTNKSREFPCPDELKEFLLSIRPDNYDINNYIFQDKKGKLHAQALWNRWCGQSITKILQSGEKATYRTSGVIIKLIEAKKIAPNYLSPYATRHTFINLQLESGMPPATVASWVGNSPEVIYRYYVSVNRKLKPSPIYPSSTMPVLPEEKAYPPLPTKDAAASPTHPKLLIHADDDEIEIVSKIFNYRIQDLLNLNAELKARIKELETKLDEVSTTGTESTSQSIEALSGLQLFQRLDIDKSEVNWCIFMGLRQTKGAEYFTGWTQHHDPQGIAWEYRQEKLEASPAPAGYYGTHLAARLGCTETACRSSRYQGSDHFADWSETRDPEGIAWEYRQSTKRYHQLPRRGKYYPVNLR
jgi:integrase